MSEIKDWGDEHGKPGDGLTTSKSASETVGKRGMLAMQGEVAKEAPPLNPDLYSARIYRTDMLSTFDVRFLSQNEVKDEARDPNQTPSFRMTISNPNVMTDLADYVKGDSDPDSILRKIAENHSGDSPFQFNIKVYVGYGELPIERKNNKDRFEPHIIQIAFDDNKMQAASGSLNQEQLDFCLNLLQRSLKSSVDQMGTPDDRYYFKSGLKDDQIVAESMVHKPNEKYIQKLSYINMCLIEAGKNLKKQ